MWFQFSMTPIGSAENLNAKTATTSPLGPKHMFETKIKLVQTSIKSSHLDNFNLSSQCIHGKKNSTSPCSASLVKNLYEALRRVSIGPMVVERVRATSDPPLDPSLQLAKTLLLPLRHHLCVLFFLIPSYSAPSVLLRQTKTTWAMRSL